MPRRALVLVALLVACAAPAPDADPAGEEAEPPVITAAAPPEETEDTAPSPLPPSERDCPAPGEAPPRPLLESDPEPPPEGVDTEPCVKCGEPLWPSWYQCPRCAWPVER